jgi:uncharacterized Zn finger protein (UPF0148 family)
MEDILIGYKEGKPCPICGTLTEKIKTGSTSSFICPRCQPRRIKMENEERKVNDES